MSPYRKRCPVIRNHQHSEILTCFSEIIYDRLQHLRIYTFHTRYFTVSVSLMRALIRTFKMHIYKVHTVFEFTYGRFGFSLKIRMKGSCSTFHIHGIETCAYSDTLDEIHRRYGCSLYTVLVVEG